MATYARRKCPVCGIEFQARNGNQLYCSRECTPAQGSSELSDEELRARLAGLMNWFCGGDPEKLEKLARYFENENARHNPPTLAEVIGPYQQQEVFFTDAD